MQKLHLCRDGRELLAIQKPLEAIFLEGRRIKTKCQDFVSPAQYEIGDCQLSCPSQTLLNLDTDLARRSLSFALVEKILLPPS
jgi:hypothetical protein